MTKSLRISLTITDMSDPTPRNVLCMPGISDDYYHRLIEETDTQIFTTPTGIETPNIECIKIINKSTVQAFDGQIAEIVFEDGRIEHCQFQGLKSIGKLDLDNIYNNAWIFDKINEE